MSHASNGSVQFSRSPERRAKRDMSLGVARIEFDRLQQNFRTAGFVAEIGDGATGIAQHLGTTIVVSDRKLCIGHRLLPQGSGLLNKTCSLPKSHIECELRASECKIRIQSERAPKELLGFLEGPGARAFGCHYTLSLMIIAPGSNVLGPLASDHSDLCLRQRRLQFDNDIARDFIL